MAREPGLDALRAALTILVVLHHTALTYGAVGGWYYREVPLDGRLETKLLIFFCTLNQAYFMGLFFLLAGYFTPGAVARHGAWGYLRLVWPVGTQVYGLQAGYFASYLVLYAGGCLGARSQWLISVPARPRLVWLIVACVALPVLPGVVLLAPQFPGLGGNVAGGWNVQAVVYAFWEPAVAWGVILALLHSFVRRFRSLGVIWSALARRAYTIFIIHPPILVAVALAFRPVSAPHLVKFAVIGLSACLACFWCAGLLLRVPAVRRVV